MVGSAVDTIVWSSDASRMTSIRAPKITRTRWVGRSGALTPIGLRLTARARRGGSGRGEDEPHDRGAADQCPGVPARGLRDHVRDCEIEDGELDAREQREQTARTT